jgi:hypothetical protein
VSPTKTFGLKLAGPALVALALALPATVCQAQPAESKRVVAILVVDSKDEGIGKAVLKDGEQMKQTLEEGFGKNKEQLLLHPTVEGDNVTPDGVLDFIDKLEVEKTDTLLFYYSGHGAWDPDKGQYLQMYSGPKNKRGDLFRTTLVSKLKAKNARLTVVLTDICNGVCPSWVPLTRDLTKPPQYATLRNLLLLPDGLVDVTSSAKGELSWTRFPDKRGKEVGSVFTVVLADLFRHELKPGEVLTWKSAHASLQKATQEDYEKFRMQFLKLYDDLENEKIKEKLKPEVDLLRKQEKQTVHAYSLPGSGAPKPR